MSAPKRAVVFPLLLLAACRGERLPTESDLSSRDIPTIHQILGLRAPAAFVCEVRVRTRVEELFPGSHARSQSAWRHGRGFVQFAPDERAHDGAVMAYHFRGYENGTEVVSAADCLIPRTGRAIQKMNAGFGVLTTRSPASRADGLPTGPRFGDTQCVESTCTLQNLYVSACSWGGIWPNCYNRPESNTALQCGAMDPACGGWGGGEDPWNWDGGGGTDPYPPPEDTAKRPCHTGYEVLDDSVVQAKFMEAWETSGYDTRPLSDRIERGGWVIKTAEHTYTVEAFPATWRATACGIELPSDAWPPLGTVAMFHTHPYRRGELLTACDPVDLPGGRKAFVNYRNESSIADDSALTSFRQRGASNLIGLILDADKISAYDGSGDVQVAVDRCGY